MTDKRIPSWNFISAKEVITYATDCKKQGEDRNTKGTKKIKTTA